MKDHCFRSGRVSYCAPFRLAVMRSYHMLYHCDLFAVIGSAAYGLIFIPDFMIDHLDAEQGMAKQIAHVCVRSNTCVCCLHLNEFSDIMKCCSADKELAVKKRIYFAYRIS